MDYNNKVIVIVFVDAVVAFTGDDEENPPPAKDGEAWAQSSADLQVSYYTTANDVGTYT